MDTTAPTTQVLTIQTLYTWVDTPMAVSLLFGLAGAVFVGIYFIRRRREKSEGK